MSSSPFVASVFMVLLTAIAAADVPFQQNYFILFGEKNIVFLNNNLEAQLALDQYSGSAFGSFKNFTSGSFEMRIKIPVNDTTCTLTTFYLRSYGAHHDELDFEFYGGKGQPYILQTNVYANDNGDREQKIALWFDPTADFHNYRILWNQHQVAFFVDDTPIRVYKNNTSIGVNYPYVPMRIEASQWNVSWACQGGSQDWSQAPFKAYYEGFGVTACDPSNGQDCYSPSLPWNDPKNWKLDAAQNEAYRQARTHLVYDYCTDKQRYPQGKPECKSNEPYS